MIILINVTYGNSFHTVTRVTAYLNAGELNHERKQRKMSRCLGKIARGEIS